MAQTPNTTNPKRRVIAVNGSGGAQVTISASKFARYVEIEECAPGGGGFTGGNYAPQGLNYQLPDDGFVATYGLVAGDVFTLGDREWMRDRGVGQPGWIDPSNNAVPATIYMKVKSTTVTGTQVEVREWS